LKPKYDINDVDAAKNSRIVNRFIINQYAVVTELLDKYPLLTRKHLDYLDFPVLRSRKVNGKLFNFCNVVDLIFNDFFY